MDRDVNKVNMEILRKREELTAGLPLSEEDIRLFFYRNIELADIFLQLFIYSNN